EWLLKHGGKGAVVKIAECMTNPDPSAIEYEEILDAAFDAVDRAALPLIRASLQRDEFKGSNGKRVVAFPHVMARLERLLALKEPSDDELIVKRINSLVADPANCRWDALTTFAVASGIPAAIELVWGLAEHKSKPVRDAAAAALAALGDA